MNSSQIIRSNSFSKKPLWFNAINGIWKSSYFTGTKIKLDKDLFIKEARKATGLQNLGADFWDEPLERLIKSIEEEARLHPIGRFITKTRFVNLLSVRLRAEEMFRKNPALLEQEVYPMLVICGLQRTGTTKLHRLLSSDPDNRVLLSWEAINPVPLKEGADDIEKRKAAARLSQKALQIMAPGFFSIHPVEYEKPEEDILLLDTTFLSTTFEATMHVPSYAAWLEKTDQSIAYQYLGKLLKLLQHQRGAKRWVLKTPHHLEFLDLLHKNFKDVQFVWTHRNINESLTSFLSMVAHSRAIFSDEVSEKEVAEHWVRKTEYMLQKGIQFRQQHPNVSFTDIPYKSLIDAPIESIEKIYGRTLDAALKEKFLQTENENTQHRFGKHVYKPEDFYLSQEGINQQFRFYSDYINTIKK